MPKALSFLVVLAIATAGLAQAQEQQARDRAAALQFVQTFYDWYVPKAAKLGGDPVKDALKHKASSFSPPLREALLQDIEAQEKADEIVGLDFDPFLNSQDPGEPYVAVAAKAKGKTWLVSVHPMVAGGRASNPAVVAVIEKGEKGWRFTNFLQPDGEDLLTLLARLKQDRQNFGVGYLTMNTSHDGER
jgi:hypothetical protein